MLLDNYKPTLELQCASRMEDGEMMNCVVLYGSKTFLRLQAPQLCGQHLDFSCAERNKSSLQSAFSIVFSFETSPSISRACSFTVETWWWRTVNSRALLCRKSVICPHSMPDGKTLPIRSTNHCISKLSQ